MNTTADLSILTLIANASLVVKAVLAILIVLSLASWTVIFQKFFVVRRAMRQTDDFESRFWSGTELTKLLDTANRSRDTSGMEERIFAAGMNEFMKQRQTAGAADTVNSVSRRYAAVFTREMDDLKRFADACLHRFHFTLHWSFRHGLGHHERFHGALELETRVSPLLRRALPRRW